MKRCNHCGAKNINGAYDCWHCKARLHVYQSKSPIKHTQIITDSTKPILFDHQEKEKGPDHDDNNTPEY
ncbi:MAG: hypothetical protein COS89_03375 [Deltaproteobacteria bacterium CG07_land_8_20_14_0_80_38_7]|nr:MAG: hypothetical protein COS89_03375 [Deltaproteobacteria bacterium CG07_land_8_20_14_0_80_38_7]